MTDATVKASPQWDEKLSSSSSSSKSQLFDRTPSPVEATCRAFYNPKDEDFLLLEDLPGSGLLRDKAQESIRVINGEEIVLIEDFLRGRISIAFSLLIFIFFFHFAVRFQCQRQRTFSIIISFQWSLIFCDVKKKIHFSSFGEDWSVQSAWRLSRPHRKLHIVADKTRLVYLWRQRLRKVFCIRMACPWSEVVRRSRSTDEWVYGS